MPKKQNTRAQKARQAARSAGAKYTAALRASQQSDAAGLPEDVAALLPPHMIALLNAVVTVEPGTDPRAVAQAMADAVLTLPVRVAAIIRPYDVPLSEEERAARLYAEDFQDDPDGDHLLFLVEVFYLTGDLPDEVDQVARRLAGHWRAELGAGTGVLDLAVAAGDLFGPQAYEALYDHRLDWDVRTPDPHDLVPPMARNAGPLPRPAAPGGQEEAMTEEQVAAILHISPLLLPAIVDSGCRFVRTPDGAIEQRSAEGLVCRWEHAPDGAVHQVVYDRDGLEDTRLLTGLTTLRPAEDG
jgi:hypothetical protein